MNALRCKPVAWLGGVMCLLVAAAPVPVHAQLNVRELAPGIYYGAAPETTADYDELSCLQINTAIDIRKLAPRIRPVEAELLAGCGITYINVPMGFYPSRDCSPERVLALLADPARQPIYLHCTLGRDRTGLVVALYRVRYAGWSPQVAYAAFQRARFNPLLRGLDRYFWRYAW